MSQLVDRTQPLTPTAVSKHGEAMENFDVKPLSMLQSGRSARVVALAGGNEFRQRLVSMGLIIGSEIRIVSNGNSAGPTLIASGHSRLALGRGMTTRILVVEDSDA